jgi:UDP-2,3-diacylglucosamine pyrophosphatase LpxH
VLETARANPIRIDELSRFVFLSDCHRGSGGWSDDFSRNVVIYLHAVQYYLERGFTLVEAGDGEELWENRFEEIHWAYSNVYTRLGSFHAAGRFIKLWGNHDDEWRSAGAFRKKFVPALWRKFDGRPHPLLEGMADSELERIVKGGEAPPIPILSTLEAREGIVLRRGSPLADILVIHGHQGDFWSDSASWLSRIMVHNVWKWLQKAGLRVRNTPAGNYALKDLVEGRLKRWTRLSGVALIAGHTHQPSFPRPGDTPYFNCGSCVHPGCITCIELCDDTLSLVKWGVTTLGAEGAGSDGDNLRMKRSVLQGPEPLADCLAGGGKPHGPERRSAP